MRDPAQDLRDAAAVVRQVTIADPFGDERVGAALAAVLDKAAVAWPLDHAEPPRNPRDRDLVWEAYGLARAVLGLPEEARTDAD